MHYLSKINEIIERHKDTFEEMATFIYYHPEVKFKEYESFNYYVKKAKEFGFEVNTNIPNLPTALVASFGDRNDDVRHIGFLGEYDALPGLYQTPFGLTKDNEGKCVGHGCGHNLLGVGSFIAAVAVKELIESENLPLRVSFYGCPGEEIGSGKAFMTRDGVFDDLNLAYCWHPSPSNSIISNTTLANVLVNFHFKGVGSHAANSPELGRSALDAVELMNVGTNYLREHIPKEHKLHYAITNAGGLSPSIVQSEATVQYLIRALTTEDVYATFERVQKIAHGAAMMTETEVEVDFVKGCSNYIGNKSMERVLHESLLNSYELNLSDNMYKYAEQLFNTFSESEKRHKLSTMTSMGFNDDSSVVEGKFIYDKVSPYNEKVELFSASLDMGDVSWVVPTAQLSCATSIIGTPLHTWQMTAQGLTELAFSGMFNAGRAMASASLESALNDAVYANIQSEFNDFRRGNLYQCPIPDEIKPR